MNTKEEMIIKNTKLIHYVIHKRFNRVYNLDKDEIYEEGMVGLVKAVEKYDPEKGAFSSFAVGCIRNEIGMFLRKNIKHCNNISLDEKVKNDKSEEATYMDLIEDRNDRFMEKEMLLDFNKNLNKYTGYKKQIIIYYLMLGQKQNEIAQKLNISQAQVSRIIKEFRENYKKVREIL